MSSTAAQRHEEEKKAYHEGHEGHEGSYFGALRAQEFFFVSFVSSWFNPSLPCASAVNHFAARPRRGGEMRPESARGESPLTLPASRGPSLSREGRGECCGSDMHHAFATKLSMTFLSPALSNSIDSLLSSTDWMVP
jgi:hypothetical protein